MDSKYERYVVRIPRYNNFTEVTNIHTPMTVMSPYQVPEVNCVIELSWISGIPEANPCINEHVHDFDQIILFWGSNPGIPQVLGGEIEFYMGGQLINFNTTAAMFIPKGTAHGFSTWKKFNFPHVVMVLSLDTDKPSGEWNIDPTVNKKKQVSQKTTNFDYEQYVVRSPMRELARNIKKGRQSPTMTYMSSQLIPKANYYIEFGWVWDIVERSIPEMVHQDYDEIVLHIGGDPQHPEDLGGDVEFHLGGYPLILNTTSAVFIPKGLSHGPLRWTQVRKPHIEMAIMLGCGTVREGWGNAFTQIPPTIPI